MNTISTNSARPLAVWIAIAILSGLGAVISWRLTLISAEQVTHTLIVQRQLSRYLSAAQDMEIGHRGYLLTRDEGFLEPFNSAKKDVTRIHEELPGLVRDNPRQAQLVEQLDATVTQRLAAIERSVESLRSGGSEVRPDAMAGLAGKKTMDQLRAQINEALNQEQELFESRSERYRRQSLWLLAAMVATLLSSAGLALLAFIRERERAATLEITAHTLAATNKSLEVRVKQRTEEVAAERDRAEALLRDVTHRIGNALALVVGFINLHIRHTTDPASQKTLSAARDRIHAIASAQRRINVTNDLDLVRLDSLIESVIKDVVTSATEEPVKLKFEVEPLLAPAQLGTSLCVLIQEFVVNALKHAFMPGEGGTITVGLVKLGSNSASLTVEDNGRGMAQVDADETSANTSEGLGKKIAALLTKQFNGDISYDVARPGQPCPGTRVTIKLLEIELIAANNEPEVPAQSAIGPRPL